MADVVRPQKTIETDVLVIGTGPIGCTFARLLVEEGRDVLMIDAGAQLSEKPGQHLKNAFLYQRDIDRFTPVVQGHLNLVSIPTAGGYTPNLDPIAFRPDLPTIRSGQNPNQDPARNLPAAAVSYGVGGMFTHWTCNTPRHHPELERIRFIPDAEWDVLYAKAESLFDVHTDVFSHSLRHQAVKEALESHYGARADIRDLPVAGHRRQDNDEFVHWTGSDTVLGPLIDPGQPVDRRRFQILPHHRARSLSFNGGQVKHAVVDDLMRWEHVEIRANLFIVCCGSILTCQLLWNSHITNNALGRYLTEHPMTFCQIVMRREIIEEIGAAARVKGYRHEAQCMDPIPFPMTDPPPMVWIAPSPGRPWHCQVHRDSFSYGNAAWGHR